MPQYQGVWNLAQQAQALTSQRWVTDPLFDYTTLLLQADGTSGGAQNNAFIDSSNNYFFITRNPASGPNAPTQGSFSPFSLQPGEWANYFDGTGDYLTGTITAVNNTTMTMECWVWFVAFDNTDGDHLVQVNNGANTNYALIHNTNGAVRFLSRNNTGGSIFDIVSSNGILQTNKWHHIVGVRNASSASLYVDGTRVATVSSPSVSSTDGTSFQVAYNSGASPREPNGYISNVRIVSGTAVYDPTSSFLNVPTSPLSAVSGTRILTCQANRFVDNSGNNVSLTVNGTPSVQPFSPFAPQYQYTPTVTGSSGYFDGGTTNYLVIGSAGNFNFLHNGSSFSIEFSVYRTDTAGSQFMADIQGSGDIGGILSFGTNGQLVWEFIRNNNTGTMTSTVNVASNTWSFVQVIFNGSTKTMNMFVNGQAAGTTSFSSYTFTTANSTYALHLGNRPPGLGLASLKGYIGSLRLSDTARSSGIPTGPYTNDANTKLLLNFTNAGIYDGTMKNNLETVGNAQVSTSVVKYGSGSMYFDGNGDYLLCADRSGFDFGTGDFTLECWVYLAATPSTTNMIIDTRAADTVTAWSFSISGTSKLDMIYGAARVTSTGSVPTGAWTHVAATRTGGTIRLFINGVQDGSVAFSSAINSANTPAIGGGRSTAGATVTGYYYNGYMDDLRITKGIARYTRNFTPPQVALPRQ